MIWGRFQISVKTPQRLFMASLVIFFLTLGVYFTQVRSFSNPKTTPVATNQNENSGKNKISKAAATPPTKRIRIQKLVIQRSKVNENAIMAFVFFNSKEDFESAKLEQRGTLLNTFQPYLEKEDGAAGENLSIFLFDESGNVVQKSNFQLPEIQDD